MVINAEKQNQIYKKLQFSKIPKNCNFFFSTHWQTKKTRAQAIYLLLQLFLRLEALDFLDCVSNRINSIWMPNGHHDSCSSGVASRSTPSAPWIITRVVAF